MYLCPTWCTFIYLIYFLFLHTLETKKARRKCGRSAKCRSELFCDLFFSYQVVLMMLLPVAVLQCIAGPHVITKLEILSVSVSLGISGCRNLRHITYVLLLHWYRIFFCKFYFIWQIFLCAFKLGYFLQWQNFFSFCVFCGTYQFGFLEILARQPQEVGCAPWNGFGKSLLLFHQPLVTHSK